MALTTFETAQVIIMVVVGTLSLIGSILVIFTILKKDLYKSYAFKILFYISINDVFRSLLGILPPEIVKNLVACSILAFFSYSFFLSSIVWACCLSFTIFQIIVLEDSEFERFHMYWFILAYGVVTIITALPFITSSYGYSGHVCELNVDLTGNIWRFAILYIPASILLCIICVLFVKVYRKIKLIRSDAMNNIIFNRGFIYALAIGISLLPYEILRIIQAFNNDDLLTYIAFVNYVFLILHGFINAIIFFTNSTVKEVLKKQNNEIYSSMGIVSESDSDLQISFRSTLN